MIGFAGYIEDTSGCCGVLQITGFTDDGDSYGADISGNGETEEQACKEFFDNLKTWMHEGYIHQMWFVKLTDYNGEYKETYEREPLRQLVAAIPGVLDLGEHRNPNTGNMIQGYQWRAA